MIRQAISCDVCGTEKRQTNHWFVAFEQAGELRLGGWTSRNRARPGSKHLCGQTCVHKLVDEYMAQIVASKPLRNVDDSMEDSIEFLADSTQDSASSAFKTPNANKSAPKINQLPAARVREQESTAQLIARSESARTNPQSTDRSLATEYDFNLDQESSARVITPPEPSLPAPVLARLRPAAAEPIPVLPHTTPQNRPSLVAARNTTERTLIELPLADEAPSFSSRKWRNEAWDRERERELRAASNHPTLATRLRLN